MEVEDLKFDTIASISTPLGEGGIGVIRISGNESFKIAEKLFRNKRGVPFKIGELPSYSARYGYIFDPLSNENIDETIMLLMRAPHTYTREDIVEFQCHGGMFILNRTLELVLKMGARPADPGEFTKRAFLNGRIDLTQAEAVLSIVQATSERAREVSFSQLSGGLSKKLKEIEDQILESVSWVDAIISFPDEDITPFDYKELLIMIDNAIKSAEKLIGSYDRGKILTQGVKTVIVGRPNVGKSSLLNTLLEEERAIVTPIAGTTRDSLRESVTIGGVLFHLIDTAGITNTENFLDKMGVERSMHEVSDAELILFVIDNSSLLTEEDFSILKIIKDKNFILVLNKIDLPKKLGNSDIEEFLQYKDIPIIPISASEKRGIEDLEKVMQHKILKEDEYGTRQEVYLTQIRHKRYLEKALTSLNTAKQQLIKSTPVDIVGLDLEEALRALYVITGKEYVESVLETIFSNFCVGK